MKNENLVQSVLFPGIELQTDKKTYFRLENSFYQYDSNILHFQRYGSAKFNTYYNSLSLNLWQHKCKIDNLSLYLSGCGMFNVVFYVVNCDGVKKQFHSNTITLNSDGDSKVAAFDMQKLPNIGLLCFDIIALSDNANIVSGSWRTSSDVVNKVKLGITITHFNRKQYVLPSIKRIKEQLLEDKYYQNKISFTVIDNSQNIEPHEAHGVNVIPNDNLGGSGGFMRGLLHYQGRGDYTHVLFMDDDASCEIDSIRRAYAILSYAKKDDVAVSGALLKENMTHSLIEQGATFDRVCRPLFHNKDVREVETLIEIEKTFVKPGYGAWWFFAFPIRKVKSYAFPFFVRGDDVLFSMMNDFNIITTSGICCYGEDFASKVSGLTRYLDSRSGYMNMLLHDNNATNAIRAHINLVSATLFSGQYDSVACIRRSIYDVAKGKEFWLKNVDMQEIRNWVGKITVSEKMSPIDLTAYCFDVKNNEEHKLKRLIRKITLNGNLLPSNGKMIIQEKGARASLRQVFRYDRILYVDMAQNTGYITQLSKLRFFKELLLLVKDCIFIACNYKRLSKHYRNNISELTSKKFWDDIYN